MFASQYPQRATSEVLRSNLAIQQVQQVHHDGITDAAYGTYVVFGTHVRCKEDAETIWDPKNEVKVLVCLTWGFQLVLL